MTEFTKGPWKVREDARVDHGIEYIAGLDIISDDAEIVGCEGIASNSDVNIANAHLIAAAPDLYEALEALTEMARRMDFSEGVCCCGDSVENHGFGSGHSPVDAGLYYSTEVIEVAQSALAKARGEA